MAVTVESAGRGATRSRGSSFGRTLRNSQPAYILLSPYLILFVVVLAYPLLYSIYLSFFDATLNRTPTFVGVGNFVQLFTDAEFYVSLRNTFFFSIFVVAGETQLKADGAVRCRHQADENQEKMRAVQTYGHFVAT